MRALSTSCLLLLLFACGGRSLTIEEIAAHLSTVESNPDVAQCEATVLYGSEMSDSGIRQFVLGLGFPNDLDGELDIQEIMSDLDEEDQAAFQAVIEDYVACIQ
jgi:hypothetical protein